MIDLETIVGDAKASFSAALTPADLENAKALFLGKTGRVTELMKGMAQLSVDEKNHAAQPSICPSRRLKPRSMTGGKNWRTQNCKSSSSQRHST